MEYALLVSKKSDVEALLKVKDLIAKAAEKSEYKVENLLALLKPAEKAKKTTAKKATKKK